FGTRHRLVTLGRTAVCRSGELLRLRASAHDSLPPLSEHRAAALRAYLAALPVRFARPWTRWRGYPLVADLRPYRSRSRLRVAIHRLALPHSGRRPPGSRRRDRHADFVAFLLVARWAAHPQPLVRVPPDSSALHAHHRPQERHRDRRLSLARVDAPDRPQDRPPVVASPLAILRRPRHAD